MDGVEASADGGRSRNVECLQCQLSDLLTSSVTAVVVLLASSSFERRYSPSHRSSLRSVRRVPPFSKHRTGALQHWGTRDAWMQLKRRATVTDSGHSCSTLHSRVQQSSAVQSLQRRGVCLSSDECHTTDARAEAEDSSTQRWNGSRANEIQLCSELLCCTDRAHARSDAATLIPLVTFASAVVHPDPSPPLLSPCFAR